MDDESGSIEAKEGIAQGEEPGETTEGTETNQTADSVSTEESEDYSLISEADSPSGDSQVVLEVEVVLRDDELMVFGDELAVQDFIQSLVVPEEMSAKLDSKALNRIFGQIKNTGSIAQGASEIAENSGYYIKLTQESAALVKEQGLFESKAGTTYAKIKNLEKPGKPGKWLKVDDSLGSLFTNPAVLSGLGGMMTQAAVEQALAEITSYLEDIKTTLKILAEKVDDSNISDLNGVYESIQDEIDRRNRVGTVDEIMWSKVSSYGSALASARNYAFQQTDSISQKLKSSSNISDLNKSLSVAMEEVPKWLVILAHIRQAELWLDELELEHRFSNNLSSYKQHADNIREKQKRKLAKINEGLDNLLDGIERAARLANDRMVLNRSTAEKALENAKWIEERVHGLKTLLETDFDKKSIESRELSRGEAIISKIAPVRNVAMAAVPALGLILYKKQIDPAKIMSLIRNVK